MRARSVLIVESSPAARPDLAVVLSTRGYRVTETRATGLTEIGEAARGMELVVLLPAAGGDELDTAVRLRRREATLGIIIVAGVSSEDRVIRALRTPVHDYFKHSASTEEIATSVDRWFTTPCAVGGGDAGVPVGEALVGLSAAIQDLRAYATKAAASDSHVLITGETGTGKELMARLLHRLSARRDGPFVSVNCAAIPDTLVESELFGYEAGAFTGAVRARIGTLKLADRGTLFFDEIGDMTPYAQAKILRAVEQREVSRLGGRGTVPLDVRVVAATNQDIEQAVEQGRFRRDLYFRINVARMHLPPLRERREDVALLLDHYLCEFNRRFDRDVEGFTDEAFAALVSYPWPGNVRELKNVLEAVFVNLPPRRIALVDLPEILRRRLTASDGLADDERARLLAALLATDWNKSRAAERLRWSRMTIYRKIAKYHLVRSRAPREATA